MGSGGTDWRGVLVDLHEAEGELASLLRDVAGRHGDDRALHDECVQLADWSAEHVVRLTELGRTRGLNLDPETDSGGALVGVRDWAARLFGGDDQVEMLLVEDMRRIYLTASATQLDWRLLDEIGRSLPDGKLCDAAAEFRPRTERLVAFASGEVQTRGAHILTRGPANKTP
jgi:hypothetical protein